MYKDRKIYFLSALLSISEYSNILRIQDINLQQDLRC